MDKLRIVAIIFALFFGVYGIHWFYLNDNSKGITYLITTIIGLITSIFIIGLIPLLIICIMSIVDLFKFALMSDEDFNKEFNVIKNVNN